MTEISLAAVDSYGIPRSHGAWIAKRELTGRKDDEFVLRIGDLVIRVWPADPDAIDELGEKLQNVAARLRER